MAIQYPGTIPDLLTRFGLDPLDFSSYQDLLRELQAELNALGTNPQGGSGTVANRILALETARPGIIVATGDSTAIANTTTETVFSTGSVTIPANSAIVGRTYRITAGGKLSTLSSAPGTLTFNIRWGGANTDPLLVQFGPSSTLNTSLSSSGWFLHALVTVRTIGVTGTAAGTGAAHFSSSGAATLFDSQAGTTTINTTASIPLSLFAKWSVANAANTITLENFLAEQAA